MFNKAIFFIILLTSFNVISIEIDESMTGSWFDQKNSGQGINIEILSENRILVYWYTYDNEKPLWLTGVGTYQDDTAEIQLSQFNGSEFGVNHNTSLVTSKTFGSLTISFDTCDTGSMTYNSIQGFGAGTISLNRLTSVPGLPCTTPATSFSQPILTINKIGIKPRACTLVEQRLTCEFSITSAESDTFVLLEKSIMNIDGSLFRAEGLALGSSSNPTAGSVGENLTKGIPIIGKVVFSGVPSSLRIIDLLQLHFSREDVDFFDAIVINEN